jgi:hypothetical protein
MAGSGNTGRPEMMEKLADRNHDAARRDHLTVQVYVANYCAKQPLHRRAEAESLLDRGWQQLRRICQFAFRWSGCSAKLSMALAMRLEVVSCPATISNHCGRESARTLKAGAVYDSVWAEARPLSTSARKRSSRGLNSPGPSQNGACPSPAKRWQCFCQRLAYLTESK